MSCLLELPMCKKLCKSEMVGFQAWVGLRNNDPVWKDAKSENNLLHQFFCSNSNNWENAKSEKN